MSNNTKSKSRYMPGLDGLRALSVLAVIAYHLNLQGTSGGFLGVAVFFVLSGYLITDQLVAKWQTQRTLDLKDFWIRRARRLLPAMLAMTAAVSIYLGATDPARLSELKGDIVSAVAYVNNWWLIFHNVSYFESFGPPSPFGHFWSLAVEEQFYLLWPVVLLALLKLFRRRMTLAFVILVGAAASALAMALLYSPDVDPSRVYYGTDTRAFGLLIGAALAAVWPSARLQQMIRPRARFALDFVGFAALAAIIWMTVRTTEYDPFVYRGGLALLSVATALVIANLAHPASRLAKLLSWKPLRWLGARSYGIYLWHFPVIALTSSASEAESPTALQAIAQTAASILLAAISWKLIEEPFLKRRWKSRFRAVAAWYHGGSGARRHAATVLTASLTIVLCVSCVGAGSVGDTHSVSASGVNGDASADASGDPADNDGQGGAILAGGQPGQSGIAGLPNAGGGAIVTLPTAPGGRPGQVSPPSSQRPGNPPSSQTTGGGKPAPSGQPNAGQGTSGDGKDSDAVQSGKGITVIGDSVMVGVKPYLEKRLPGIVVDGKVGRQLVDAQETVDAHVAAGDLGDIVVIELGTNGPSTKKKVYALLDSLGKDRRIVIINTRVPRKWQDDVNALWKEAASDYANATLVDWYAKSKGKDSYFGKDGVHLTRTGAEFYADMIADALAKLQDAGN